MIKGNSGESLESSKIMGKTSSDSSEDHTSINKSSQERKSEEKTQEPRKQSKTSSDSSEDGTSVNKKSSQERKSEEKTQEPRKQSKTSSDSSEGRGSVNKKSSQERKSEEKTQEPRKQSKTSSDSSEGRSSVNKKSSQERKSEDETQEPRKRSKTSSDSYEGCSTVNKKGSQERKSEDETQEPRKISKTSSDSSEGCSSVNKKGSQERKSEDETQEPRKISRNTPSPSEGTSHQTSVPVQTAPPNSRAAFESKYEEWEILGSGGLGTVYVGYCKYDNTPVAIKHIRQRKVERVNMWLDDDYKHVPLEVGLMIKLKPAEGTTSAAVALLDWYDLNKELILVLEKPDPCMDLKEYMRHSGGVLCEKEAKVITKQLVDAAIEIHSKNVFHGDIKLTNILIHTSSDVPHVRLIDFGCGAIIKKDCFNEFKGTFLYMPPESHQFKSYMAEPTTVWQLGVVLFQILHVRYPFENEKEIISKDVVISAHLSGKCQNFIRKCLSKRMVARPTLAVLRNHPWLY